MLKRCQTANYIALKLDRDEDAEMSCISGVGGNVPHLVNIARSGRSIMVLDGCPLACTLNCLSERGITADYHLQLHEHGVKKRYHADFDQEQADQPPWLHNRHVSYVTNGPHLNAFKAINDNV